MHDSPRSRRRVTHVNNNQAYFANNEQKSYLIIFEGSLNKSILSPVFVSSERLQIVSVKIHRKNRILRSDNFQQIISL